MSSFIPATASNKHQTKRGKCFSCNRYSQAITTTYFIIRGCCVLGEDIFIMDM